LITSTNKVLVTGGAGFIGSHVAEHYAKTECEVVVLDNLSRADILGKSIGDPLYNWNYLGKFRNVKLVKGDVRRFEDVKGASKGVDAIVHCAAQVAVTFSLADPKTDFEMNALGTFNALEAARQNDSALILASTNKVYGENVNEIPVVERETRYEFADQRYKNGIPEDFPIDRCGHSPYGCSKLAADLYAQDYAHTYKLKTGVFRLSCVYGERQFGVEDQGWVAWFVIATLTNKPITIYGDGKQVRDILYVGDLIEAFDAFIKGGLMHEVFNIGGGPENTLSVLEFLGLLRELTGKKSEVRYTNWRPNDQKIYVSRVLKAERLLKWKPKTNPVVGVKKIVKWVSENVKLFT